MGNLRSLRPAAQADAGAAAILCNELDAASLKGGAHLRNCICRNVSPFASFKALDCRMRQTGRFRKLFLGPSK